MEAWLPCVENANVAPVPFVEYKDFRHTETSDSWPVKATCERADGTLSDFWIKGRIDRRRGMCSEHIVGVLGRRLGAATSSVYFASVTDEDRNAKQEIEHLVVQPCHAIDDLEVSNRDSIRYDNPENRPRFAGLEVLYSWIGCESDHQLFYENSAPHLVHSFDHGHFFAGSTNWTADTLHPEAIPVPDQFFAGLLITNVERAPFLLALQGIDRDDICAAVASVPESWGITIDERVALATYLHERRRMVLEEYGYAP